MTSQQVLLHRCPMPPTFGRSSNGGLITRGHCSASVCETTNGVSTAATASRRTSRRPRLDFRRRQRQLRKLTAGRRPSAVATAEASVGMARSRDSWRQVPPARAGVSTSQRWSADVFHEGNNKLTATTKQHNTNYTVRNSVAL